jgi:putative tributyrin esterase
MAVFHGQFFANSLKKNVPVCTLIPEPTTQNPVDLNHHNPITHTLYLLHGYTGSSTSWLYNTRIHELSNKFGIAIVMPSGENSFYLDLVDRDEMYGEFIGHELPQFIERTFSIPNVREQRLIGGLSMGGFGAMRNGLKYHEMFSGIIAMSSAFIIERIAKMEPGDKDGIASYGYYASTFGNLKQVQTTDNSPAYLVETMAQSKIPFPKIFMACGREDFLIEENRWFHQQLVNHKIHHEYVESSGEHDWKFWDRFIEIALNYMIIESS